MIAGSNPQILPAEFGDRVAVDHTLQFDPREPQRLAQAMADGNARVERYKRIALLRETAVRLPEGPTRGGFLALHPEAAICDPQPIINGSTPARLRALVMIEQRASIFSGRPRMTDTTIDDPQAADKAVKDKVEYWLSERPDFAGALSQPITSGTAWMANSAADRYDAGTASAA